ncbi:ribonuclease P protein component 1 [Candidatus Nanopusillus massiliensis]|uniref:ribonuclease P protein component 1 n=1 Tax=Candidatus Nanopusillus massiliensis TaxID=2897163 RepID=UPI001E6205CA|nr:ribonuclease P protein subunit [Candidatus Nanopusillus massiliensis]
MSLIGLYVEVYDCKIKSLKGIYGEIIDESKNTFYIKNKDEIYIVPKSISKFIFYFNDYSIFLDGKLIDKRPWESIKANIKKKVYVVYITKFLNIL